MVNWKGKKFGDWLWLANAFAAIVLVNVLSSFYFFRVDLTEENRYTIKDQTREILSNLQDDVYVEVFLEGDMNAGFKRFQKSIIETLHEFEIYSDNKVHFSLTNPAAAEGTRAQSEFMADLARRGVQPTNVIDTRDGQRVEKIIFPGAIISASGNEIGVNLLKGNKAGTPDEEINQSIEGVEFELINAIDKLTRLERKRIGWITGHGELDSLDIASFNNDLLESFDLFKVNLPSKKKLDQYEALIIAKPTRPFSPSDKYKLDQYIMHGGKVVFLIDKLSAAMDSASRDDYFALPYPMNLDDQLFKYGVRINPDLIQDQHSAFYPVVTGQAGGKSQFQLMNWPFYPLINHYAELPFTRNLDAVQLRFANSIDTVKAVGIRKTPLLFSSSASRKLTTPVHISINDLRTVNSEEFTAGPIPTGYLLEGKFTSLYKNRFLPADVDTSSFLSEGKPAKLVVISDGDLARNEINPRNGQPQALGFDPFTNYTFANRDLLINLMTWLTEENGLIQTRSKQVMIRPLDREKIKEGEMKWRLINLVLPVALVCVYGVLRALWRRKKYASF
jgi:gliding-associated putative ABC transporter substrate-binding component GldG